MVQPTILRARFSDFDHLSETIRAWDLEIEKLDAAPFQGELLQVFGGDHIVGRGVFSGPLRQRGAPPAGFRTVVLPAHESFSMLWRGHTIGPNDLMIFPAGGELLALTDARFDVFTLSFLEADLEPLLHVARGEVVPLSPTRATRLRGLLKTTRDWAGIKPLLLNELAQAVSPRDYHVGPRDSKRAAAIRATERLVTNRPEEPPTVEEACAAAGVSRRTLEYAFAERLGATPKQFIRSSRLNAVRRLLRRGVGVGDAANAWGFWHMGQFAADYRRLFGELPSETLMRRA